MEGQTVTDMNEAENLASLSSCVYKAHHYYHIIKAGDNVCMEIFSFHSFFYANINV